MLKNLLLIPIFLLEGKIYPREVKFCGWRHHCYTFRPTSFLYIPMHELPTPTMDNTSTPKPSVKNILMVPIYQLDDQGYAREIMCDVST